MSRLIDVDNTFETFKSLPRCENGYSDTYDVETIIGILQDEPIIDAVPWEFLERYAEWFCAMVSFPEFIREAKQFYLDSCNAMKGGAISDVN